MKQTLIALLLITVLLAACGPAPTPEPTVDVNATIQAMSQTMTAGTLTAQPTPTDLPTATPLPSDTPTPLLPTDTPAPTTTLTPAATLTSEAVVGCIARGPGHPPLGIFRIENNTKETLQVFLNGVSLTGNQTFSCSFTVTTSFNTEVIFGNYEYSVQIGTKRTIDGKFMVNNDDKTTMRIYDKKVVVVGP